MFADNRFSRTLVNRLAWTCCASIWIRMDQAAWVWQDVRPLKQVEDLARLDGLTGAYHPRALDERVGLGVQRHARGKRPGGMLLADLGEFKQVHDQRGSAKPFGCLSTAKFAFTLRG